MTGRIAVAQTAPTVGNVDANLAAAVKTIASQADSADLIVFPELFTTGYRREGMDHAALAEALPEGPTIRRLSEAAARARVTVIGTVLERADSQVYDTAIVIDRDGRMVGRYRKSHLYPAERAFFGAGEALEVVDAAGLRIGLAICFEHAFPEIFTELAMAGAELIAIPSAVPVGYEYLLELRTRARAQDNQLYVAAANLVGDDGETVWCGRSMIVGPRGELLASADDGVGVITGVLAGDAASAERAQEPALANRRPELYPHLSGPSPLTRD